jgi:hypothetical protein
LAVSSHPREKAFLTTLGFDSLYSNQQRAIKMMKAGTAIQNNLNIDVLR